MPRSTRYTRSLPALGLLLFLLTTAIAQREGEKDEELPPQEEIYNPPEIIEEIESDEDTSHFTEITYPSRQPLQARQVPSARVQEMKEDDAFWYANTAREKKKEKAPPNLSFWEGIGRKPWFKVLIWLLIGGAFIAIIILFLSSSNISLFRKRERKMEQEGEEGEPEEDIFSMDHDREIRRAEESGDLRRAIRYHYLATLKSLAQKDLIRYRHESTDSDYLRQLGGTEHYRDFGRLTRHFQYAWYGKFSVAPPLYKMIGEEFSQFKKRLGA